MSNVTVESARWSNDVGDILGNLRTARAEGKRSSACSATSSARWVDFLPVEAARGTQGQQPSGLPDNRNAGHTK